MCLQRQTRPLKLPRLVRRDDDIREALSAQDERTRALALRDLRSYVGRVLRRAFQHQLSEADLEDLTQESVLKVLQRMSTFEGQSRFSTWVAVIAIRQGISHLRRRQLQHITLEAAARDAAAALSARLSAAPNHDLDADKLQRGLDALTERQREALLARLIGVPLMEIARRHGTTAGAVYKMVHDARLRLRAHLYGAESALRDEGAG